MPAWKPSSMAIERIWRLPNSDFHFVEKLDKPEGYGLSYFWYCAICSNRYASAQIIGRTWQASIGCCPDCSGHRWNIPGSIEAVFLVGQNLPPTVLAYQLACELSFLQHPDHPHNKDFLP